MSANFRFDSDKYILVQEGMGGYHIVKEEDVKKLDPTKYTTGHLPNRTPDRDVFDPYFHKETRAFISAMRLNQEPPPQPWWCGRLDFTALGVVNQHRRKIGQLNKVYIEKCIIPEQEQQLVKKMKRVHFDLGAEGGDE